MTKWDKTIDRILSYCFWGMLAGLPIGFGLQLFTPDGIFIGGAITFVIGLPALALLFVDTFR